MDAVIKCKSCGANCLMSDEQKTYLSSLEKEKFDLLDKQRILLKQIEEVEIDLKDSESSLEASKIANTQLLTHYEEIVTQKDLDLSKFQNQSQTISDLKSKMTDLKALSFNFEELNKNHSSLMLKFSDSEKKNSLLLSSLNSLKDQITLKDKEIKDFKSPPSSSSPLSLADKTSLEIYRSTLEFKLKKDYDDKLKKSQLELTKSINDYKASLNKLPISMKDLQKN